MTETRNNQRTHVVLLFSLAVGMFGFAFALVPLYQIFCEITGLNGKTSGRPADPTAIPEVRASDREVTVQFLASVSNGMPWEFRPSTHQLRFDWGK